MAYVGCILFGMVIGALMACVSWNKSMNDLVGIKQNYNDYATLISVDKSVKRLEVEFNSTPTKVTKVVVEVEQTKEHCHDNNYGNSKSHR